MSCSPGTPCYNSEIVYSGCGNDPCNPNSRISCDGVVYSGPNLPCTGVESCDTLCVALQKIDESICNTPGSTVTANNGLAKTLNNIQLGGPLVQSTVISTSSTNTLSITGLVIDPTPDYILTETSLGVVRKTLVSSLVSDVTANNGLTKTLNNIRLGGNLVVPTTIGVNGSNTLSITGLSTDSSPTFLLTETGGLIRKASLSTVVNITASNGLNKVGSDIQLGGPLLANTSINLATYTLTFTAAPTFTTALSIIPGAASPNPTSGVDRIAIAGNLSVSAQSYFFGNVGMGATPFLPSDNTDIRLNTFKVGLPGSTKSAVGASNSAVELTTAGTYTGTPTSYLGSISRVNFTFNGTGAQALNPLSTYTGGLSYFQFGTGRDVTGGVCSAHAAQAQFAKASLGGPSRTIDKVIVYRAMRPVADALVGYNGTITEMVGLQIEAQNGPIGTGTVTNSYGIKQLGTDDVNSINGKTLFNNKVGVGYEPEGAIKLYAYNQVDPRTIAGGGAATTNSEMYLLNTSGSLTTNISSMVGLGGGVALSGNRVTQPVNFGFSYMTGLRGGVYFAPSASITGTLCSVTASSTFQREPVGGVIPLTPTNLTTYIAFRALSPTVPLSTGTPPDPAWYGTLTNSIGLLIESQKRYIDGTLGKGTITNSYGVVQGDISDASFGIQDTNMFNAEKNVFRNIPLYANDSAATADANLPSGSLYRISADIRAIRWKP